MLGLFLLVAGSLLTERHSFIELQAMFPDPCGIEGQEFRGFVGGKDRTNFWYSQKHDLNGSFFFGPTGALSPIEGRNETWALILPCPFVRGQGYFSALFPDENTARESLPKMFANYLAMKNAQRKRAANARGRGSYESEMQVARSLLRVEGSIFSFTTVSETIGSCFCRKEG